MGYADGYYYGQGRIICDTSTFSVGDTIRVRSMTDSSKVWNQQVATVGTALVFTVPCYDYYKICTVQTINDTPTEIGGVYKTVDYGQTLFIDVLDEHSFAFVQNALNNHQEVDLLNIGDEFPTKTVIGGTPIDWVMQIGNIDGSSHIVDFVSKYVTSSSFFSNAGYTNRTDLQNYLTSFYDNMRESDKRFIKDKTCTYQEGELRTIVQKVWIPSRNEVFGNTPTENNTQLAIFTTQAGRIKTIQGGNASYWQLTSRNNFSSGYTDCVSTTGAVDYTVNPFPILPCFRLTADS